MAEKTLSAVSNGMADLVQAASAQIVRVEGRRRLAATGVIWSADGLIISSHHGVTRDEELYIGLPDGNRVAAMLVGRDPGTDIALLKAEASGLQPATWAAFDSLKVGHLVLALGRPGDSTQATLGVISALGEGWRTGPGSFIDSYIQTDVAMYPGFSGGPLLTMSGDFAGMNSSALARGVSLTLPAATLTRVAGALLKDGRIRQGYLGVGAQPVRLPDALAAELKQPAGLMLASVEPGSPAAQGGLLLGDVIVAIDGIPTPGLEELLGLLSGERVGKAVTLKVLRGGALAEFTVTVGERG